MKPRYRLRVRLLYRGWGWLCEWAIQDIALKRQTQWTIFPARALDDARLGWFFPSA